MSTKIGVLEVSSFLGCQNDRDKIEKANAVILLFVSLCATDGTRVRFAYPQVTPISEAIDQIAPRPYRPYKPGRYQ